MPCFASPSIFKKRISFRFFLPLHYTRSDPVTEILFIFFPAPSSPFGNVRLGFISTNLFVKFYICLNKSYMCCGGESHKHLLPHPLYNFLLHTKHIPLHKENFKNSLTYLRSKKKLPKEFFFIVLPFKLNQNAASLNPQAKKNIIKYVSCHGYFFFLQNL